MGYNRRNDEIRDNIEDAALPRSLALAAVEQFNARLSAKKSAAALTSKHYWLVIACDSCDTIIDLDLTVKLPIGIAWTTFGVVLQRLGLAS